MEVLWQKLLVPGCCALFYAQAASLAGEAALHAGARSLQFREGERGEQRENIQKLCLAFRAGLVNAQSKKECLWCTCLSV